MTTGPRLRLGESLLPGVLAVALFGVMALIVLNTPFAPMADAGYPGGISITSEIGYAMFDLSALQSAEGNVGDTEPFLAAFLLIAVVLDAALDASLVLAKRETEGEPVAALSSASRESPSNVSSGQVAATDGRGLERETSTRSESTAGDDGDAETEGEDR
ncbi:hypothetical protein [Natronococcus wangiae]|uniref:hypothetical protein n=1 Tax=Natronococcus wangiae TaxID=3068275 RepID=UPI00273CFDB5|nr:hypothetical protein [Natronococcus sp. AD5]